MPRVKLYLPYDRVVARRHQAAEVFLLELHGAVDLRPDVHLQPHEYATIRVSAFSDVRGTRFMGRAPIGKQQHRRDFPTTLGLVHRLVRELVLGGMIIGRIKEFHQKRGVRQFVKFGIVGASGFIVNLIVFTLLQHFTPKAYRAARYSLLFSISFLSGGISNYFLNRIWTFRAGGDMLVQGVQFLTVSCIALIVGLIVSHFSEPILGVGHRTWLLATVSGIIVNFFVNKYWTFRSA
jgi:putative flippase GtrA